MHPRKSGWNATGTQGWVEKAWLERGVEYIGGGIWGGIYAFPQKKKRIFRLKCHVGEF